MAATNSDQTAEHVQMAQKLFKRYGGKRLEVFKNIQYQQPTSSPAQDTPTYQMSAFSAMQIGNGYGGKGVQHHHHHAGRRRKQAASGTRL